MQPLARQRGKGYTPQHDQRTVVAMSESIITLDDLWPLQAQLNQKAGFDTLSLGHLLRDSEHSSDTSAEQQVRLTVGVAMKNYLDALVAEVMELQDCLNWKH